MKRKNSKKHQKKGKKAQKTTYRKPLTIVGGRRINLPKNLLNQLRQCTTEGLKNYKGLLRGAGVRYKIVGRLWNENKEANIGDVCENIDLYIANIIGDYARYGKEAEVEAIGNRVRSATDITEGDTVGLNIRVVNLNWWKFKDDIMPIVNNTQFLKDNWKVAIYGNDDSVFEFNNLSGGIQFKNWLYKKRLNSNYFFNLIGLNDYTVNISFNATNLPSGTVDEWGIKQFEIKDIIEQILPIQEEIDDDFTIISEIEKEEKKKRTKKKTKTIDKTAKQMKLLKKQIALQQKQIALLQKELNKTKKTPKKTKSKNKTKNKKRR